MTAFSPPPFPGFDRFETLETYDTFCTRVSRVVHSLILGVIVELLDFEMYEFRNSLSFALSNLTALTIRASPRRES